MNKRLSETSALITGASGEIGRAIAERFAAAGIDVAVHYFRSREAAEETVRRCLEYGVRAISVPADLRRKEQILRMKEKLRDFAMMPYILVNNAGIAHYGLLQDVEEEEWDDVMAVNLKGMFLCTQAFIPEMIGRKYGRIVNVSSIWGLSGASCEVVYSTAKGGMNAFTKALAKELAPSGITVNAVAPGAVETAMNSRLNEEEKAMLTREIPAGRFASPEEIASLVHFLSLPESGYITGQIISPNGGWLT